LICGVAWGGNQFPGPYGGDISHLWRTRSFVLIVRTIFADIFPEDQELISRFIRTGLVFFGPGAVLHFREHSILGTRYTIFVCLLVPLGRLFLLQQLPCSVCKPIDKPIIYRQPGATTILAILSIIRLFQLSSGTT
jgi:hypothetical protein